MMPEPRPLPRTLVTASAGSGKTYRLSTEILDLLARGAPPGSILASTFTRKAAGEILERVLLRLAEAALDPEKARTLGTDAGQEALKDPVRCQAILHTLLGELHQFNVSTLDSFFVRVVRSFFHTLGLPPTWNLADPELETQLREDTLAHLMGGLDGSRGETTLLMLFEGQHRRDIHARLKDGMEGLLQFARLGEQRGERRGDGAQGFWDLKLAIPALDPDTLEARREALLASIASLEVPKGKTGKPNGHWERARGQLLSALAAQRWDAIFDSGIAKAAYNNPEDPAFFRIPLSGAWLDAVASVRDLGRAALTPALARRLRATGDLATELQASYHETQLRMGVLRFEDVTLRLADPNLSLDASEIHYRLDQEIQHVLLDEFQDTSEIQWAALEPLVGEILSGDQGLRAAVLVADPKQSIYGWRKARPELVHQVGMWYAMDQASLTTSWRSSNTLLQLVGRVFRGIETNPVVMALPGGPEVARGWMRDFTDMESAKPNLPGYVCAHRVSPTSGSAPGVEPTVLREAARAIRAIHAQAPTRSIGVLVRQNRAVAHLISELKALGVPVSGEGGAPLTDTVPVLALLSLLRLADHPADRVARYHVRKTPVHTLLPPSALEDEASTRRVAADIRRALLADGYGATLATWVAGLIPHCDAREAARLGQLVELAHRWDPRATLRPTDFVHHVKRTVVEDPSAASVRVMTVHKSKGLEFDIVALPDLYQSLSPRRREWLIPNLTETGEVDAVFPAIRSSLEPYFPEIAAAKVRAQHPDVRDSLSLLYVALTRPRQALHLFIPENGGGERSAARLLATALEIPVDVGEGGDTVAADPMAGGADPMAGEAHPPGGPILKAWGNARWFEQDAEGEPLAQPLAQALAQPFAEPFAEPLAERELHTGEPGGHSGVPAPPPAAPLLLPAPPHARRNFPRSSPSQAKGGGAVDLSLRLYLGGGQARDRGTLVHAWCEAIPWLEDGLPSDDALRVMARRHAAAMAEEDVRALMATFRTWMAAPEIAHALSRERYLAAHPGASLEVHAEFPFLHLANGVLLEGFVDRLVVVREGDRVVAAEVLDFKTDRVVKQTREATAAALADRTERYRAQIAAYCAMVCDRFALASDQVRGTLLFLEAGLEGGVELGGGVDVAE